ncbi:MAG: single-stranded-DNA-specific exonuclease RecJ, partial [Lachnospira sp.]|nr:single-stranded-DNA-specific exonuclease RecJ [Lachnospira sp.]
YPFDKICGAAVAFKLVQVLYDKCGLDKSDLKEYSELMAIATVGDVVDLKDENRVIVKNGLQSLATTKNMGIRALTESCKLDIIHLTAYHIGFIIGPCLNASGRLDTAKRAIELLLCDNPADAHIMAEELRELNEERKNLTDTEAKRAARLVEETELSEDKVLVVYLPECHESVAGIIAGRLREHFYKPVIVITDASEGAKGSGRSIEGYNMFEEISKCGNLLTKFGGHPMAAGLSLPKENIDIFRKQLNANQTLTEKELTPVIWIDVPMPVSYVGMQLVEQLHVLEPFGKGNEKPVFADKNLTVRSANIIGKNRNVLKMQLESADGHLVEAIQFKADEMRMPLYGQKISIVYYPDINEYNGNRSLQFVVQEWCVTK